MDETGESSVLLVARFLLGSLFLWSGIGQIQGYDETAIFLTRHGVIGGLLPIAIFIELAGAVLIIAGYRTRWSAWRWPASASSRRCCSTPTSPTTPRCSISSRTPPSPRGRSGRPTMRR